MSRDEHDTLATDERHTTMTQTHTTSEAYPSYLRDVLARLSVHYKLIDGRAYRSATIEEVGFQVSEALKQIADPFRPSDEPFRTLSHSIEYASWGHQALPEDAHDLRPTNTWPETFQWIAVYAVTGGSEGHYVHVDLIYSEISEYAQAHQYRALRIATIKTFGGALYASYLAGIIAQLLGA